STCHEIGNDIIGPNLAHFPARISKIDTTVANGSLFKSLMTHQYPNQADTTHTNFPLNLYRCNLQEMFGIIGTPFPALTDVALKQIARYIQQESDNRQLPLPKHASLMNCI